MRKNRHERILLSGYMARRPPIPGHGPLSLGMGLHQPSPDAKSLLRQGLLLEFATLGWNVIAVCLLLATAITARSVAFLGFGLDSLIEIGASVVVVWQLRDGSEERQRRALRIISLLFMALAVYIAFAAILALVHRVRPARSMIGTVWLTLTLVVMLALAAGKQWVGKRIPNPVLLAEARVTLVDAYLAGSVLTGVLLDQWCGWWWADPLAGLVIVFYGIKESRHAWREAGLVPIIR